MNLIWVAVLAFVIPGLFLLIANDAFRVKRKPKCPACGKSVIPQNQSTLVREMGFTHLCEVEGLIPLFLESNNTVVRFKDSSLLFRHRILCSNCQSPTYSFEFVCGTCGLKPTSNPTPAPYPGWTPGSNFETLGVHNCSVCGDRVITSESRYHVCRGKINSSIGGTK